MNIPNTKTPLLDQVEFPEDLRKLEKWQLRAFADELRTDLIDTVSVTGGHFGSSLGVVELTTALHYVFKTPADRVIWDVGHQAYPHKILTGRRSRMRTLRQAGGLSGFTRRCESEYDPFGAAHSSTSISAGVGMAVARDLLGGDNNVIAVIGDGSMSAGMAYEAMNNAGANKNRLIVILNDNDMSIAPPVGAMSAYLARLVSSRPYTGLRNLAKRLARKLLPRALFNVARRTEEYARGMAMGGTLFEEMGFFYVGPIDGHNLDHLVPVLENVRDTMTGPVLVHVVTKKGHGYAPRRSRRRQVACGQQVRGADRRAGQAVAQGPGLPEGVRRKPDCRGEEGRPHRRHHRGDAVGHRGGPVRQGLPDPYLRCRHRRAAWRDLRRRHGDRGHEALLRHLFHLPAARL